MEAISFAKTRIECPVGALVLLRVVHIGGASREVASHEAIGRPMNRGGPKNGKN